MDAFAYVRAADVDDAAGRAAREPGAAFIGGGTNLRRPDERRRRAAVACWSTSRACRSRTSTRWPTAALRIGALVRNSDLAEHRGGPQALSAADRRRCWPARRRSCATWRRSAATCCSARVATTSPTSRSRLQQAQAGLRLRARSTASTATTRSSARASSCIATHPSDMCVALAALDARVSRARPGRRARDRRSRISIRLPGAHARARHRAARRAS